MINYKNKARAATIETIYRILNTSEPFYPLLKQTSKLRKVNQATDIKTGKKLT